MQPNRVKKILKSGGIAMGTYVGGMADPQVVEIIGHAGFDAAFIDMEHTAFDLQTVQLMVMAAERVGVTPIVRPPGFDPAFLLRLLDMGVQGLQIPHITDANAAREAVKAVRYPPLGERGIAGATRASNYGAVPLPEHMKQSNEEITLAVMIEDMPSLDQIEEIAQVEGIDIVAIGPSDLSRALGVAGSSDHPKMTEAVNRVRAALAKGKGARLALPTNHSAFPRNAKQLLELGVGYTNFAPSPEARLLKVLREQLAGERKAIG